MRALKERIYESIIDIDKINNDISHITKSSEIILNIKKRFKAFYVACTKNINKDKDVSITHGAVKWYDKYNYSILIQNINANDIKPIFKEIDKLKNDLSKYTKVKCTTPYSSSLCPASYIIEFPDFIDKQRNKVMSIYIEFESGENKNMVIIEIPNILFEK